MSAKTIIAWTDKTFNIAWGCAKVSAGCKNCYAATLSDRYGWKGIWGLQADRRTSAAYKTEMGIELDGQVQRTFPNYERITASKQ